MVFVVEPAQIKLTLTVEGGEGHLVSSVSEPWFLVRDHKYHVELQILDLNDHRIEMTKVPDFR